MPTRRNFMLAVATASVGCVATRAFANPSSPSSSPSNFLVDHARPQAADFIRHADQAAMRLHDVGTDVAQIWRSKFDAAAADQSFALAGLTCPTALFCLERMAWDRGLRVMFRVDHVRVGEGRWQHIPAMPVPDMPLDRLAASQDKFGGVAFDLLASSRPLWRRADNAAPPAGSTTHAEAPMTSWVIAPASSHLI